MRQYPKIIIIIAILLSFSCEESLQPYVINQPQLSVEQKLWKEDTLLEYYGTDKFYFVFEVVNEADEVVEEYFFFSGTIECYVNEQPEPLTFTFTEEREGVYVVLIPGEPYRFGIKWDQIFDSGEYLAEYLVEVPGSVNVRSKAKIQLFRYPGLIQAGEIEFTVGYVM